ncbi:YlxR family protein [Antrihabitans sp. YC2-6]|uniref:YlxR family protein n=1 Tax=Antrihabitans sp. YC2-6 TaxID=2799498 RepID=UPI0018F5F924|nr:YlxR family protein [Antrihabitans sp. YC2-6]MBJ8344962.1 YlxR family protein [Antrihabitans sp. YC2-6]
MVQHEPSISDVPSSRLSSDGRPVRMCIGCRERVLTADLLRIVALKIGTSENAADGYELQPDPRHRLPGRGAWLHPDPSCLRLAERRRAFGRALRVSGHLDISGLVRLIEPDRTGHELYLEKNRHEHS